MNSTSDAFELHPKVEFYIQLYRTIDLRLAQTRWRGTMQERGNWERDLRQGGQMSAQPLRSPLWRNLRLSVRVLLIVVLIMGGGLGWVVRCARVQRESVAAIKNVRGSVGYEWDRKDLWPEFKWSPPWPRWLVNFVGVDYFGHAVLVLVPEGGSDAEMSQVANLSRLERLGIHRSRVTDAGLKHLTRLSRLERLSLNGTKVTDAGVGYIKGLTGLTHLDLGNTGITDAALAQLENFTNLRQLIIDDTKVTDAGLVHLKPLTNLQILSFDHTAVTDQGLVHLRDLIRLESLFLDGTRVSDAGVRELQRSLPKLSIQR